MARRPTVNLQLDPRNANHHTEQSLAAVKRSVEVLGPGRSIVADRTGTLIGGEATLKAARDLGLPIREVRTQGDELVVVVREDLAPDDNRRRALALADNQTAKLADFDEQGLVGELQEIAADEELLGAIGFSDQELRDLLEPEEPQAVVWDDQPTEEVPAVTRPGDLWTLGRHRLICGDSTNPDVLDRLMDGQQAQLVFTDPPYGVSYTGVKIHDGTPRHENGWTAIEHDHKKDDQLIQELLIPSLTNAIAASKDDAAFYIWHGYRTRRDFEFAIDSAGLIERQYIVWVKPHFVLYQSDYHNQFESCFYCEKAGQRAKFSGDRKQVNLWRVTSVASGGTVSIANGLRITDGTDAELFVQTKAPKSKKLRLIRLRAGESVTLTSGGNTDAWEVDYDPHNERVHPTQKPAELAARAIRNHCGRGDLVLDLFGGSGSTMMACEQTGTCGRTIELAPNYCDAQIRRWQAVNGGQAVRHDGVTFNELAPPEAAE
jgi:DNA modification methylase